MRPDPDYKALLTKLEPIRQRLRAKGYFLGLHLTSYPIRYQLYHGHNFLFTETDGDKIIEKATEFVESRGKPDNEQGTSDYLADAEESKE